MNKYTHYLPLCRIHFLQAFIRLNHYFNSGFHRTSKLWGVIDLSTFLPQHFRTVKSGFRSFGRCRPFYPSFYLCSSLQRQSTRTRRLQCQRTGLRKLVGSCRGRRVPNSKSTSSRADFEVCLLHKYETAECRCVLARHQSGLNFTLICGQPGIVGGVP